MSTFTVAYPSGFYAIDAVVILVLVAVGAYLALRPLRHKYTGKPYGRQKTIKGAVFAGLAIPLLISLYFSGAFSPSPSVSVGGGQILLSASPYFTRTVDSGAVIGAYVTTLGSGNTTIGSRFYGANWGTASWGDFALGQFALNNGATAYVLSGQSENVVMRLSDGTYLVLGPSDFGGFVAALEALLNRTIPTQA